MPSAYLALAKARAASVSDRYRQPEDFGYDFSVWISPYTKGAHALGGIAVVLQDWLSADTLASPSHPRPDIQELGRDATRDTNKNLQKLLSRVFGLSIGDVYVTNAFPFIKLGANDANVSQALMDQTARDFAKQELEIVAPKVVMAMGRKSHTALTRAGIDCFHVSHPAARGMKLDAREEEWRRTLPTELVEELYVGRTRRDA